MDSLTQAVLGAVVGEAVLGRKAGWRGAAWGAFFGTLPDLDVIALPFLKDFFAIYWHRGLSHSILVMVLASLFLARPIGKVLRKYGVTTRDSGWMIFWTWSTHVLIDCFTTYGTQIFEPFSNYRVATENLYIIDPLFTLPLLIGLVMALRIKNQLNRRKKVIGRAIMVAGSYVLVSFLMQGWARRTMSEDVEKNIPKGELVAVAPSFLNTILWRGLIEVEEGFFITYWSPFDKGKSCYEFIEKKHHLVFSFEGTPELEALKWFSRGYWVARKTKEGELVFIDMRFASVRDLKSGFLQPIFQWLITRDEKGAVQMPMVRPKGLDYPGAMGLLRERVRGNRERWEAFKSF